VNFDWCVRGKKKPKPTVIQFAAGTMNGDTSKFYSASGSLDEVSLQSMGRSEAARGERKPLDTFLE